MRLQWVIPNAFRYSEQRRMSNRTVPAVDRAFRILDLFNHGRVEYGVSEVSHRLGLHKSTVHGILHTMVRRNILVRDESTLKYRLGPGLVDLGDLARQRLDLREAARPILNALAEQTGETVFLGVFERGGITIVEKAEARDELRITAPVGQRVPYSAGSFGRAFLAFMSSVEVGRLLREKGLRKFTDSSVTDLAMYKASLETVRRRGYAVDDTQEYLSGVWAASAPIFDQEGVTAALTVVALAARLTPSRAKRIIRAVAKAAREISQRLGGGARFGRGGAGSNARDANKANSGNTSTT